MAGVSWIASPSLAMTGGDSFVRDDGEGGVIASGSDAIQLVVGEGWLAWERRVWHQLDRFAFVVQNDSQDRFAACGGHASPRDDGWGGRSFAMTGALLT